MPPKKIYGLPTRQSPRLTNQLEEFIKKEIIVATEGTEPTEPAPTPNSIAPEEPIATIEAEGSDIYDSAVSENPEEQNKITLENFPSVAPENGNQ